MSTTIAAPISDNPSHLIGRSYENALKQSIDAVLSSIRGSDSSNAVNFSPKFRDFVQSKADPPLESVWIYGALTSACCSAPKTEPFGRISAVKDLFQLVVSCSASCNSIKSLALAAPVVFYLHGLIVDFKGFQLSAKRERKVKGEIKALIDSVLGYVNVCCNGFDGNYDDLEGLVLPLGDLVRFWVLDNGVESKTGESLKAFFPLLSEDIVGRAVQGCGIIDLTGFVIAEAFLLKLCWKIREEGLEESIKNELRAWVVGSVTGFRSPYFFVTLVNMLLEPALPTASLLNAEHENGLRKILYDAFILVEYSFLSPESVGQLSETLAKRVIVTKLMATHQAIELFREHGDHAKAILYSSAFASSTLPSLLIKWVKREVATEFNANEPTGTSPRAFIRWILNIENKGIKIFDDDMSKFKAAFNLTEEMEQVASGKERDRQETDLIFYIDNKGQDENRTGDDDDDDDDDEEEEEKEEEEEMNASMSSAFITAARSLQPSEKAGRKRKTKDGKGIKQIKFVKYDTSDHSSLSRERSAEQRSHHSDSESDVENPSSDEDMRE